MHQVGDLATAGVERLRARWRGDTPTGTPEAGGAGGGADGPVGQSAETGAVAEAIS